METKKKPAQGGLNVPVALQSDRTGTSPDRSSACQHAWMYQHHLFTLAGCCARWQGRKAGQDQPCTASRCPHLAVASRPLLGPIGGIGGPVGRRCRNERCIARERQVARAQRQGYLHRSRPARKNVHQISRALSERCYSIHQLAERLERSFADKWSDVCDLHGCSVAGKS